MFRLVYLAKNNIQKNKCTRQGCSQQEQVQTDRYSLPPQKQSTQLSKALVRNIQKNYNRLSNKKQLAEQIS